jgi:hypothetical protein
MVVLDPFLLIQIWYKCQPPVTQKKKSEIDVSTAFY